jgi:hypothetical protein
VDNEAFQPYVIEDPARLFSGKFSRMAVLGRTFCGVYAVERLCHVPEVQDGVRARIIMDWQLPSYPVIKTEEISLQSVITELKEDALAHGATPEAIQLLGSHAPFSDKEYKEMANKLKSKAAAKAAPAKKAATKAPKAEKAESGPDLRKITVVKKDHGGRAGTKRTTQLDIIYAAKTVEDARNSGAEVSFISWAAREGLIKLS